MGPVFVVYILNDTSNATKSFCYNFKTTQDIEMKIAGTIERFMRRVLKAKLCQPTFIKKCPGRLDTPHLIFKSHKTKYSEQRSLQDFLCISFSFCFLFLPQHIEGRTFLRKTNHMHGLTGVCVCCTTVRRLLQHTRL